MINVETQGSKLLPLDYRTPEPGRPVRLRDRWRRAWLWLDSGPDTLPGCLALFFAVVPVLFIGIGAAYGALKAAGCVVFPLCAISALFGVSSLLDRRGSSRTLPLVSFVLIAAYVAVYVGAAAIT